MYDDSGGKTGKGGLSLRDVAIAAAFSTVTMDNALANSPDGGLAAFPGGENNETVIEITLTVPPVDQVGFSDDPGDDAGDDNGPCSSCTC